MRERGRDVVLALQGVSKKFRRGELYDSLRDLIPALAGGLVRRRDQLREREFWALRDVSFEVPRGEAFGIIGSNGAGKSTILKLLSRIMRPTTGTVQVNGSLSALIEVGAGFHPDLTGRENIYLNGTILGMKKEDIRARFDAIVEFSGLRDFIDTPVKRYSSGMYARLGFSVAAHVEPDLLIVDEVLSVGDYVFQKKCMDRMKAVVAGGATVVFVSHNLRAISDLCLRSLLLEKGRMLEIGPTDEVIRAYLEHVRVERDVQDNDAFVSRVSVRSTHGACAAFTSGGKAWIDIEVTARRAVQELAVVLQLQDERDNDAFNTSTVRLGMESVTLQPGEVLHCTFELDLHLAPGSFQVNAYLHRYDVQKSYDEWLAATSFIVHSETDVRGVAHLYPVVTAHWVEPAGVLATATAG